MTAQKEFCTECLAAFYKDESVAESYQFRKHHNNSEYLLATL